MTGVIGGFTHSVGQDVAEHPELYRETRDGPQLLYLTALFALGFLEEIKRECCHVDRSLWVDEPAAHGRIRVHCRECEGFIGFKRIDNA